MTTGSFTTSDGLSLGYEDHGTGTPMLCLPGLTRNARDFDDLAAVLPDGIRMIRLTFRGREGSDWAPDPSTYQIPIEARDTVEFLDHIGLDKVTILGTSRGGLVAMVMAATVKDRLAGVILNDIGPEIADEGLARIKRYVGRAPTANTYGGIVDAMKRDMGAGFRGLDDARWRALAERWFRDDGHGLALRYDPRIADAMAAAEAAGPPPDLWPLFDAFAGLPLAIIRGANSDLLTSDTVAEMARRRPDMVVAEVPDRGHVPCLDEPQSLAAIQSVLARVTA